MTCIIIEDQPPAQRIVKKFIEDIGSLELLGIFAEAPKAMEFMSTTPVDLIFLDVHLPKISGIEFLKAMPNHPQVILTTAYSDYALEGYELNVVDYLLKPFSFQRFVQAVTKAQKNGIHEKPLESKDKPSELFIKMGYEHVKLVLDDIIYIQSDADYTEVYLADKKHISSEPLRFWVELLHENQFVRIHKSYIVNTSKIEKVAGNRVFLNSEKELPIGRAYKDEFAKRFLK